jgi:diguanylate cyclase
MQALNDAEIARRALKLLAERKVVPTPETFADAFRESAGLEIRGAAGGLGGAIRNIGADLVRQSRMTQQEAAQMLQAAYRQQWSAVHDAIDSALARRHGSGVDSWPAMALTILKQSDALHANWTRARKLDSITRVIESAGADPSIALERLRRLVESWGPPLAQLPGGAAAVSTTAEPVAQVEQPHERAAPAARTGDRAPGDRPAARQSGQSDAWRQLALRALRALEQACSGAPQAREKLRSYLAHSADDSPAGELEPVLAPLESLLAIEREIAEDRRIRDGLQRLLGLLCHNLEQLAPEEAWLTSQLEPVRSLLAGPILSGQIAAAERRLAALIVKQAAARRGLQETKVVLTEMLTELLERIGAMDSSTGRFQDRVGIYHRQLQESPDPATLTRIVHGLIGETRTVREQIESSRAELTEARQKVGIYEARVSQLEHQLDEVSMLVQKDSLTNALNRRGLERAFRTESARALRYESPLALAMMDLDNFKQINDRLGHVSGDRALVHFVTTVHATLRPTDLTARTGGEEFGVLFPASHAEDAADAVERLQRELTRRPVQFEEERLALTFSAGIAQWRPGETLEQLMQRADDSLYDAKRAGKNRVFKAP